MLLFLLFSFFLKADQATLVWRQDTALTPDRPVFVKDVFVLKNIPHELEQKISEVAIAESSSVYQAMNQQQVIKSMGSALREIEGQCACRILFQGARETEKELVSSEFSFESVVQQIQNALKKECVTCQFDVSAPQLMRGQIPATYTKWSARLVPEELRGPSMIRIYFDENFFNPLILQTMIRIQKPVLQIKQAIATGQLLQPEHFAEVLQDVTYENRPLLQRDEVVGKESKRSLAKGHILSVDDLRDHNVIRFGQPVSIEMQKGSFTLEMSGVAQRQGKIGDKIPIKISKTQKQIFAEVIGDSKVRF